MKFRKLIFWAHLVIGVVAGIVILSMSVTGVMLAFQRQIFAFAERDVRTVTPPTPEAARLSVEVLIAKARESQTNARPSQITLRHDPTAAASIGFGREGLVYVNPYTGEVTGSGSSMRATWHQIEEWHRWLGSQAKGKAVTGAACAAFGLLLVSGLFLWWPRQWKWNAVKAVTVFDGGLRGKARDWNWHNVIGFWAALPILITVITGLIMSYTWVNNLMFRITGNEPPAPRPAMSANAGMEEGKGTEKGREGKESRSESGGEPRKGRRGGGGGELKLDGLDQLWTKAAQQANDWQSISARLPGRGDATVTFTIDSGEGSRPDQRFQVTLDRQTGEVTKTETFAEANWGRKLRLWTKPVHTGEAGGWIGQSIAALTSLAATLLVWTGLALAFRRFFKRAEKAG